MGKKIELESKDAIALVELLDRGRAYTDMYYRDDKKMDRIFWDVVKQLEQQGAEYILNGKIRFKRKRKSDTNS